MTKTTKANRLEEINRLVFTRGGLILSLDAIRANLPLLAFPFRNDRNPLPTDHVALYTEADFSGYSGAKAVKNWQPSDFVGANNATGSLWWLHGGGPTDNNIFGLCFVTVTNVLVAAIRVRNAPLLVNTANRAFAFTPTFSTATEFPGPEADDDSGAGEAAAAENWLTGYLSGGARPSEEIALYEGWAAGFSRDAVLKAKKAIGVKVSKTGLTGCTWSLPEELHRLNPDADDDSLFDV